MQFTEQQLNTPVSSLTIGDLLKILGKTGNTNKDDFFDKEEWICGSQALAKFIHCSKPTISRLVKRGVFDGAYIRSGNVYWFDRAKIKKMLENNQIFNGR